MCCCVLIESMLLCYLPGRGKHLRRRGNVQVACIHCVATMFLLCHCMYVSVHVLVIDVFKDLDQGGLTHDLGVLLGDMSPKDAEQAINPLGYPIEGCPMIISKKKDILLTIAKHSGGMIVLSCCLFMYVLCMHL